MLLVWGVSTSRNGLQREAGITREEIVNKAVSEEGDEAGEV